MTYSIIEKDACALPLDMADASRVWFAYADGRGSVTYRCPSGIKVVVASVRDEGPVFEIIARKSKCFVPYVEGQDGWTRLEENVPVYALQGEKLGIGLRGGQVFSEIALLQLQG